MILTKEVLKAEIDKVEEKYLEILYRIIQALEVPSDDLDQLAWQEFIEATYGSLGYAPHRCGKLK